MTITSVVVFSWEMGTFVPNRFVRVGLQKSAFTDSKKIDPSLSVNHTFALKPNNYSNNSHLQVILRHSLKISES